MTQLSFFDPEPTLTPKHPKRPKHPKHPLPPTLPTGWKLQPVDNGFAWALIGPGGRQYGRYGNVQNATMMANHYDKKEKRS